MKGRGVGEGTGGPFPRAAPFPRFLRGKQGRLGGTIRRRSLQSATTPEAAGCQPRAESPS